ncbi:hypothetical protein F3Y22_tig00004258pilonHSYRG00055 [Hibiscus syriacus]|uniref:Uncharacterized protein n=1 Tax=Hibiscus syriacus TaxID=106335 RepID=A0A6A3CIC1_HIBSY|nr:hypothetical protein F3Y22_tig00004258pilonHSYRG00055 [Hibiscus syriacus]
MGPESARSDTLSSNKEMVIIEELVNGKHCATQLQILFNNNPSEMSVRLSAQQLVHKIFTAFDHSLCLLSRVESAEVSRNQANEDSTESRKKKRLASKEKRGCYKRRKAGQTWTVVSATVEMELDIIGADYGDVVSNVYSSTEITSQNLELDLVIEFEDDFQFDETLSWILNSISKELSAGIVFASSVALVWRYLKERFDKVDGCRVYFLYREIATLYQGELTVSSYFTRLKLLWDEYHTLIPFTTCECEISQSNLKHMIQQQLFQFLMGLSETYSAIRSQLLWMQPIPSVNQAYSMVIQEESQRIQLPGIMPFPETTVNHSIPNGNSDRKRFNGVCDYFKIRGHKRENCYRLIGYPADFKFTRKKGSVVANCAKSESDSSTYTEDSILASVTSAAPPLSLRNSTTRF